MNLLNVKLSDQLPEELCMWEAGDEGVADNVFAREVDTDDPNHSTATHLPPMTHRYSLLNLPPLISDPPPVDTSSISPLPWQQENTLGKTFGKTLVFRHIL